MSDRFAALELDLRPEVSIGGDGHGPVSFYCHWSRVDVGVVGPAMRDALEYLATHGATPQELVAQAAIDGPDGASTMSSCLDELRRRGMVRHAVRGAAGLVARATSATGAPLMSTAVDDGVAVQLSRFAYVHHEDGRVLVESPTTAIVDELLLPIGAALVAALAQPRTVDELAAACAPTSSAEAGAMRDLLIGAGMAAAVTPDGEASALRLWEFHDLLFHSCARRGRRDRPYGSTQPRPDAPPPLPTIRSARPGTLMPLHRPNLDAVARIDRSLTDVIEERRSTRTHGTAPITIHQLGELLFRVARARALTPANPDDPASTETSDRPYPSGGAAYDLEIYLTVHACAGLGPGLYHYDPAAHALHLVSGPTQDTATLLTAAADAAEVVEVPQVLVTFASRFGRVSRHHRCVAYALTLKQTFCLVATAMDLAVCPLASGDADVFAAAAGTDYYAESSVGELTVGTLPGHDGRRR